MTLLNFTLLQFWIVLVQLELFWETYYNMFDKPRRSKNKKFHCIQWSKVITKYKTLTLYYILYMYVGRYVHVV